MYANSTDFKTAMAQPFRTLTCRGTLLSPAGVTTSLTASQIVGWQIDESCADTGIPLGAARAAKITLRLNNSDKAWLGVSLDGYLLTLEQGVFDGVTYHYAPIGQYVIESGRAQEQDTVAGYTGSDRMAGTMLKPFTDAAGNYPRTLLQLAQDVALQAQITLGTTSFTNSDITIPTMPSWSDGVTLRDVIGYIACVACSFARIGRAGLLEIVSIAKATAATIGPDRYKTLDKPGNRFGPLNSLLITPYSVPDGVDASRYAVDPDVIDNAANTVQIGGNPLLSYDSPLLPTLAGNMLIALGVLEVDTATIAWQGDPSWECGDRIQIIDMQGSTLEMIITKQVIAFDAGFSMVSSCVIESVTKVDSRNRSTKIFTPDGNVNAARVVGPMDLMRVWMRASDSFIEAEIVNGKGTLRENTNPESPYYGATYEGPGFTAFANKKDGEGNWIWRIGITSRGIAGDQVYIETSAGVFMSAADVLSDTQAAIQINNDAINSTVSRVTAVEIATDGLATKDDVNTKYTNMQQTADGLSIRIGATEGGLAGVQSNVNTLNQFKAAQETIIKHDIQGVHVMVPGSPAESRVFTDGLHIKDNTGVENSYFVDGKMYTKNAEITSTLKLGGFQFVKYDSGRMSVKWVG